MQQSDILKADVTAETGSKKVQDDEARAEELHAEAASAQELPPQQIPFWRMMLSVMQASFGVQNRKNRERDFSSGSVVGFIAAALIFTILFVFALVIVVSIVLP